VCSSDLTVVLKGYYSQTLYFKVNFNKAIESILGYFRTISVILSNMYLGYCHLYVENPQTRSMDVNYLLFRLYKSPQFSV
jgi:hypothetical protein